MRSTLSTVPTYAKRLRTKAAEMRDVARSATDPELRRHFDSIAADYERLAELVERISDRNKDGPAWRARR
jgi:hypothetical protein